MALGLADGRSDGSRVVGLCDGDEEVGNALGDPEGDPLGNTDGLALGNVDGMLLGRAEGSCVGTKAGEGSFVGSVGNADGEDVGLLLEGANEGAILGDTVGLSLGACDGRRLGLVDGKAVGASVLSQHS